MVLPGSICYQDCAPCVKGARVARGRAVRARRLARARAIDTHPRFHYLTLVGGKRKLKSRITLVHARGTRLLPALVLAGACVSPCAIAAQAPADHPETRIDPGPSSRLLLLDEAETDARHASERVVSILFWAVMALLGAAVGLFVIKFIYNLAIDPLRRNRAAKRYFSTQTPDQEALCEKAARRARGGRRLDEAADLFEQAGAFARAAECAERGGDDLRAAALWERAGQHEQSARIHLVNRQDPAAAADVLRLAGKFLRAAEIYRKAGDVSQAAMMFELGDQKLEAARLHEEMGSLARAARLHDELGNPGKASELRSRLAEQGVIKTPEDAEYLAELTLRSGRRDRAAEYFALAGDRARAIEILIADGGLDRAAELHAEEPEGLGEQLLDRIPEDSTSHLAQVFLKAGDYASAARALERLGRAAEAAKLYTRAGEHQRAAALHLRLGDHDRAASAFERGGDPLQAAQTFELAGKLGRAATLYESSKAWFRAGRLWFDLDNKERALRLLGEVGRDHEQHFEATRMIAEMLLDRGDVSAAAERLRGITQGRACEPETVQAFYALTLCELRLGKEGRAIELLGRVTAHDPGYRGAAKLLAALRSGDRSAAAELLPDLFGRDALAPQPEGGA